MASIKTLFSKHQILICKNLIFSNHVQFKAMSQYPSFYVKPIYSKEAQKELAETGEIEKLVHIPTRAALNNQTCSIYHDPLLNLFINYVMKDGNKELARELVSRILEKIKRVQLEKYHKATDEEKEQIELNPKKIFYKAIENGKPLLKLTPIKRGGVTYQVPVPIAPKTAQFMSMKWFIEFGKEKDRNVRFYDHLAFELINAAHDTGRVIQKKQELHRQCEANRAYAHYRWS